MSAGSVAELRASEAECALEAGDPADGPDYLLGDARVHGSAVSLRWTLFLVAAWNRPARKGEAKRAGSQLSKLLRQVIESVNETFKCRLDLERHRGRAPSGVIVRALQRMHALTAAIWHNEHTGQPIMRSLTAYDS